MFKKIGVIAMTLLLGASCLWSFNGNMANADVVADTINYVSFGDSIADGTALAGYSQPSSYTGRNFTTNSYTKKFKDYLSTSATVSGTIYAKAGDDSADLLSLLTNNNAVKQSVANADVVTISIGGNDLLKPATANIQMLVTGGDISTEFDKALVSFETNINSITQTLNTYNPNAKYIFTTIYNPFKSFISADHDITLNAGFTNLTVTKERLQYFGQVTEDYLAGRQASGEQSEIVGINQLIANSIQQYSNMIIVDTKKVFDEYTGSYTDLVNADALNYTSIQVSLTSYEADILSHLDPHPTIKGHQFLTDTHTTGFSTNYAIVDYNYNGGSLNDKSNSTFIANKNQALSEPQEPIKPNYIFEAWYTDSDCSTEWNFDNNITANTTLYAGYKREKLNVTFELNGGAIDGQTSKTEQVTNGGKVVRPTSDPAKNDYIFTNWYKDSACTILWNFDNIIEDDVTIYAGYKRAKFSVTFNLKDGVLDGQTQKIVQVNNGSAVARPTNNPTKEDYVFTGWFKDSACTIAWDFATTIEQDTTIYAGWQINVYFVKFNYNGAILNSASEKTIKVTIGNSLADPNLNLKRAKYLFAYWYLTDPQEPYEFGTVINSDLVLNAKWDEAITVNFFNIDNVYSESYKKGTTVGELKTRVNLQKTGTVFLYWCNDRGEKLSDSLELADKNNYHAKWAQIVWANKQASENDTSTIHRTYSPVVTKVEWEIEVNNGSTVEWRVISNGVTESKFTEVVTNGTKSKWAFDPKDSGVGVYQIQCMVNGGQVDCSKSILVEYSVPKDINIALSLVEGKKVYHLEISNCEYYDVSKFVWYKTADDFSNEFTEKIGEGVAELAYKFNADCKVCVKYVNGNDETASLASNIIDIKVDNYIDETTLISILVSVGVVVLVVIGVVISRRRYSDYF